MCDEGDVPEEAGGIFKGTAVRGTSCVAGRGGEMRWLQCSQSNVKYAGWA